MEAFGGVTSPARSPQMKRLDSHGVGGGHMGVGDQDVSNAVMKTGGGRNQLAAYWLPWLLLFY